MNRYMVGLCALTAFMLAVVLLVQSMRLGQGTTSRTDVRPTATER